MGHMANVSFFSSALKRASIPHTWDSIHPELLGKSILQSCVFVIHW